MKKNICVFGGSVSGKNFENEKIAKIIGKIIAENNFNIVFGGGENGIMGAIAQSGIENGAKTTGIIPDFLLKKDIMDSAHSKIFNSQLIKLKLCINEKR